MPLTDQQLRDTAAMARKEVQHLKNNTGERCIECGGFPESGYLELSWAPLVLELVEELVERRVADARDV